MIVAPSILSANFNNLLEEVKAVEKANAEFLHVDVMDGHFVPNISLGPVVYKNLKKEVKMIFDVHLMISNPLKYICDHVKAGADIITFHYESDSNVLDTIKEIKKNDCKVGISIKPNTNWEVLKPYLSLCDLVLVMSVEPGFGGQKFMENALDKIKGLASYKKENNCDYLIEVDGGINYDNAKRCKDVGCDVVVCGTYIFKSTDINKTIKELNEL